GGAETDLQALLSYSRQRRGPHQGDRSRSLHRPLRRAQARRPRLRRKRRRGTRQHLHAAASGGPGIRVRGRTSQRVLIVEDEHHLAEGLRFNLEDEGYSAEVEESGDRALARLLDPAQHYDLVVLDVMLPGMDGFTVARELPQRQDFGPVATLHARARPAAAAERRAGADADGARPSRRRAQRVRGGGRRLSRQADGTGDPARA